MKLTTETSPVEFKRMNGRYWIFGALSAICLLHGAEAPDLAGNAALQYWKSFQYETVFQVSPEEPSGYTLLDEARAREFPEEVVALLQRTAPYVERLHRGANLPYCNWGELRWPVQPVDISHLVKGKALAGLAAAHFRYSVHSGKDAEAVDLLRSGLRMARDLDQGQLLMELLVRGAAEATLIKAAAAELPALSKPELERLSRLVDEELAPELPDVAGVYLSDYLFSLTGMREELENTPDEALDFEAIAEFGLQSAGVPGLELTSRAEIERFLAKQEERVKQISEIARNTPASELPEKLKEFGKANEAAAAFAENFAATANRVYRVHLHWRLFRAAMAMLLEGKEALVKYPEPGAEKPFVHEPLFGSVFLLQSHYGGSRGPVKLEIGHVPKIHAAAREGDVDALQYLLKSSRNVSSMVDRTGRTPLHSAAENGNSEVVKLLLEKGSQVNQAFRRGEPRGGPIPDPELAQRYGLSPQRGPLPAGAKTALDLATENGHPEVAKLLKAHGAKTAQELREADQP